VVVEEERDSLEVWGGQPPRKRGEPGRQGADMLVDTLDVDAELD